jgi:hypothetical protein
MTRNLRPVTIEQLALFAENAGLLAAAVIRAYPEEADALAFDLFELVMTSYSQALDAGRESLSDSKAIYEFELAWRPALKGALHDLIPRQSSQEQQDIRYQDIQSLEQER